MLKNKVEVSNNTVYNTVANVLSRLWTMVANFLFVPIYIDFLGEEAYGLVTFFATMQTVLNLLGLGLSKTLRREFANDPQSSKDNQYKYRILRSTECIYWCIAFLIVVVCFIFSNSFTVKWLNVENLEINVVSLTIGLMGVSIGTQLVANLYIGCLFGLELQLKANICQVIWSIAKNAVVVLIMMVIMPDIRVFYVWHIITDVLYLLIVRYFVVKALNINTKENCCKKIDFSILRNIYKYALGIMVISLGYAFNSQFDKLIISSRFPLTTVGAYNSAFNLSHVATILTASLGAMVFPKLTRNFSTGNIDEENRLFIKVNRVSNIFNCTLGAFISVFSYEIIFVWTGSSEIADIISKSAFFIIFGTVLSALQEIPSNYLLANGITLINNIQSLFYILYVLFVTPVFITKFGIFGAAIAWFIEMFISTTIYLWLFYHRYFRKCFKKCVIFDTLLPLVLNLMVAALLKMLLDRFFENLYLKLLLAVIIGAFTLSAWIIVRHKKDILGLMQKR